LENKSKALSPPLRGTRWKVPSKKKKIREEPRPERRAARKSYMIEKSWENGGERGSSRLLSLLLETAGVTRGDLQRGSRLSPLEKAEGREEGGLPG